MRFVLSILAATSLGLGSTTQAQAKLFVDEGPMSSWHVRPPAWASGGTIGSVYGDVDGDGDVDLVYSMSTNSSKIPSLTVALNDGAGGFVRLPLAQSLSTKVQYSYTDLTLVDLDRDGDLDLVHLASPGPCGLGLWTNDGKGVFSPPKALKLPIVGCHGGFSLGVGDLDGDGDPDLVLGLQPEQILINQGNWAFAAGFKFNGSPLDFVDDIVIGDANADGLMDILFLYRSSKAVLWYGARLGGYRIGPKFPVLRPLQGAMVDLDADGIPEILLYDRLSRTPRIYAVDGKGGYRIAKTLPGSGGSFIVSDWDRDGDLDLYAYRFWRNDGKLKFQDVTSSLFEVRGKFRTPLTVPTWQFADVDGDHDLDIVMMTMQAIGIWPNRYSWESPLVLYNRERHLSAPLTAKLGSTAKVDMTANHGHVMILAVAARESFLPFGQWGVLRIDPAAAVFLPGKFLTNRVPQSWLFTVPNDNGLIGLTVRYQALDYSTVQTEPTRLTGMLRMKIVR